MEKELIFNSQKSEEVQNFLEQVRRPKAQKSIKGLENSIWLRILEHYTPKDDDELQSVLSLSLLTSFGAMMEDVSFSVKRNETIYPNLYLFVVTAAASGKSIIKISHQVFDIYAHIIGVEYHNLHKDSMQKHRVWDKCIKSCKDPEQPCNCGEEPTVVPTKHLRISATISLSKLIQTLADNAPAVTLLFDTELDSASNTNKQDYGKISPELRKAFEFEPLSSHTHSHGDVEVQCPRLSLILSGTQAQLVRFLVNKEDGLLSRRMFVFMKFRKYQGLADFDDTEDKDFDFWETNVVPEVTRLVNYFHKKKLRLQMVPEVRSLFDDYIRSMEEMLLPYADEAYIAITRRMRSILLRLCMVIAGLRAYEERFAGERYPITQDIVEWVLSWADYLMAGSIQASDILPEDIQEGYTGRKEVHRQFFQNLPARFTKKEATAAAHEHYGKNISESTLKRLLEQWLTVGLLKRESHGVYLKCEAGEEAPVQPKEPEVVPPAAPPFMEPNPISSIDDELPF